MSRGLEADFRALRRSFRLEMAISIPPGRTAALLGPNGAGKSTAVAALAGLMAIDDGKIELAGRVLDDPSTGSFVPPERRRVGVVFQDYLLFPHLTVGDNVAFGPHSRGLPKREARARAAEWISAVGLDGLEERRPSELSGGQRQRVALARALAVEPDLLLLDEPLAALDIRSRVETRRSLAHHLQGFPGPRLFITHDPAEAFLLADEIHVLEDGAITQTGSADDIRLRPRTPYVADLAGANLVPGTALDGVVDTGAHALHIADHGLSGRVLATIRPSAVAVHLDRPEGSPRNAWPTSVELLEHLGDRVRLQTSDPLPLTVEITSESARSLALARGSRVWLSVKATEIAAEPDAPPD